MNLLRKYIFWTYPRGSVHYDIMVTLILAFIFIAPRFIDFRDTPASEVLINAHEVLVREAGANRFVYEVRKDALGDAKSEQEMDAALLRVIEPIAGSVTLQSVSPVTDTKGQIIAYDATVLR